MPHATISMYPGPDEAAKKKLAEAIKAALLEYTGAPETAASVRITEVAPEAWKETVYDVEISPAEEELYIAPGYAL